jgi:DNA-directed RNA polymerase subunit alpha
MKNNIFFPEKFDIIPDENNPYAISMVIEPLSSGYGLTIGNALRRIVLNSIEGTAPIAVKLKGAKHEFDIVEGIREDLVEIIINLKNVVFKSYSDSPVVLEIKKTGVGDVLASDIALNSDVDVLTPDTKIATITKEGITFDMKIWIDKGIGFYPTEERKDEINDVDVITIDTIFNPVLAANFIVENARVGEKVDLDKVILSVRTNGSIGPREAICNAISVLRDHLTLIFDSINKEDDVKLKTPNKVKVKSVTKKTPSSKVKTTKKVEKKEVKKPAIKKKTSKK